jgi:hypothetical protein
MEGPMISDNFSVFGAAGRSLLKAVLEITPETSPEEGLVSLVPSPDSLTLWRLFPPPACALLLLTTSVSLLVDDALEETELEEDELLELKTEIGVMV